ncbi:universal stress protein [Phaeobacter sp. LSS9]|uniref:universal stress protein n=1 Tax=unclassified Phaeobacter TaxID=2621772 RepID=UPI000E50E888|nr:universal stress protein [Phaeobacter sp. LSS9]AXT34474.1 universal stress protein [Phaeobacter sp. LSS9]
MYNHILVPIDLDQPEASEKAVKTAAQIARDYGATLHFLNVVVPVGTLASTFFPDGFQKKVTKAAMDRLHEYSKAQNVEDITLHHVVAEGSIYDQILNISERVESDLIVMASHRPELSDYLLGPNAARVVRHAKCSVMVVRE